MVRSFAPLPLLDHEAYQGLQFGMTRIMGSSDMFQIRLNFGLSEYPQDCFPPLARPRAAGQGINLKMIF